jgi:hypothetical protein
VCGRGIVEHTKCLAALLSSDETIHDVVQGVGSHCIVAAAAAAADVAAAGCMTATPVAWNMKKQVVAAVGYQAG